jgi:dTDP-4-amino-4,6-dideoxygalactose transaminase
LKESITAKTSGIIAVHPFGHPFELDELRELATTRGVNLIEDAATAIGTKYRGNLIGKTGRAVCFSFHPRKLLTTGEGGCLVTDDDDVAALARAMRSHGEVRDQGGSHFLYNGLNYRLSDVNAALGLAQLRKIRTLITRRRKMASSYKDGIASMGIRATPPIEEEYGYHTYQSYVILLDSALNRDKCKLRLKEEFGIETQIGTYSLHLQPAFLKYRKAPLKNGSRLYNSTLTLPLYHTLSESDQTFVIESLDKVVGKGSR